MEKRQLGQNGPQLTVIGLGAWAIGGPWQWGWGPQDDRDSIVAIHRAVELGINWIDTAAVYGLGHSEEVVRQALKDIREEVFVATKCGLVWDDRGRIRNNLRPESIRREAEASLKRLGREVIDLYQIHWPDPSTPVEDAWGEMVRLKEEGKVRYIGVSNFDIEQIKRCQAIAPVQSLQPPYSIVQRNYEEVIRFCRQEGIGVIVYSPMQAGLLTGKYNPKRLAPDDWRHKSEFHREPIRSRILALVEDLRPIAHRYGKTVGQLAIAWTLCNPGVTAAIVGARNAAQVEENCGGAGWTLEKEDLEKIDKLFEQHLGAAGPVS
jgi:aryl-alcohol dehydrogenase-like predicted oxidoreductase